MAALIGYAIAIEDINAPNSNKWIPRLDTGLNPSPFSPSIKMVGKETHAKLVAK